MTVRAGEPVNMHDSDTGEMYNAYLTKDGKPFLMAALEEKFWMRFCRGVGRPDLVDARGTDAPIHFAWGDTRLRAELEQIFATATADEWDQRFREWDVPGSRILQIPEVMELEHYQTRAIVEGDVGAWPNVTARSAGTTRTSAPARDSRRHRRSTSTATRSLPSGSSTTPHAAAHVATRGGPTSSAGSIPRSISGGETRIAGRGDRGLGGEQQLRAAPASHAKPVKPTVLV